MLFPYSFIVDLDNLDFDIVVELAVAAEVVLVVQAVVLVVELVAELVVVVVQAVVQAVELVAEQTVVAEQVEQVAAEHIQLFVLAF